MSWQHNTAGVVETYPIRFAGGHEWLATVYQTRHRSGGRRVIVRSGQGTEMWDSLDCFDAANAYAMLRVWLAEVERLIRTQDVQADLARFTTAELRDELARRDLVETPVTAPVNGRLVLAMLTQHPTVPT